MNRLGGWVGGGGGGVTILAYAAFPHVRRNIVAGTKGSTSLFKIHICEDQKNRSRTILTGEVGQRDTVPE